ncbi:MAG: hypothetical protein JRJ60_07950 [Deltaproteobacteria bacterium]|nr:hypothetical protein [Deltaproteobacteria bacterium]
MNRTRLLKSAGFAVIGIVAFVSSAWAEYNDYGTNKPSAFRDHQQTMIWDSELLAALSGFQGELMFCTGSCFSGGFVDDLTQLPKAVVVTANTWHGFGMSLYDFLSGTSYTYAFHDAYMEAFQWGGAGFAPTFEEAYLAARDTVNTTLGQQWSWGGIEFPQFGVTGSTKDGTLEYSAGDRAILFSGMWAGNEYYLTSWDYTIAGGRDMLMNDYGWDGDAVTTLFSDGAVPPGRSGPWLTGEGTKANLIAAFQNAAATLGPGNTLVVFVIAHGRSSGVMTSRLMPDRQTIEYLLIPNGRNIANDGATYPKASYGCTEIQINGLSDGDPSHYALELPDTLNGWGWTLDPVKGVLTIQADDPADQSKWLVPGLEYHIRLKYYRSLADVELGRGGWQMWIPEGGGGPLFSMDHGLPGGGWVGNRGRWMGARSRAGHSRSDRQ